MSKNKSLVATHLFLRDEQNNILLIRRFNTGYEDGNYSVIAGHVEDAETIQQAMQREAMEEVGVLVELKDLEFIHVMQRSRERPDLPDRIDFFFAANKYTGVPKNMEKDKCDDMRWFGLDDIPDNTIPYIKSAIQQYLMNNKFSEYGWA